MQARLAAHYAACAMNNTDPNMPQGLRGKTVRMVSGMVHGAMAPTARKMLRDGEATVWLGQIQAGVDDLLQLDAERVPLVQVCWWQYEEWKANQLTGTTTVTHRSWMRASRAVAGLVNTQHLLSSLAQPAEPRPAMDNDNLGKADTPSPLLTVARGQLVEIESITYQVLAVEEARALLMDPITKAERVIQPHLLQAAAAEWALGRHRSSLEKRGQSQISPLPPAATPSTRERTEQWISPSPMSAPGPTDETARSGNPPERLSPFSEFNSDEAEAIPTGQNPALKARVALGGDSQDTKDAPPPRPHPGNTGRRTARETQGTGRHRDSAKKGLPPRKLWEGAGGEEHKAQDGDEASPRTRDVRPEGWCSICGRPQYDTTPRLTGHASLASRTCLILTCTRARARHTRAHTHKRTPQGSGLQSRRSLGPYLHALSARAA